MCYRCILSYFRTRIDSRVDLELFESVVAQIAGVDDMAALHNVSDTELPHHDAENFMEYVDKIKDQLKDFGYTVSDQPLVEETVIGSDNPIFQMLMQTMQRAAREMMAEARSESSSEDGDPSVVAKRLLEQSDVAEVRAQITKIVSAMSIPLACEDRMFLRELFSCIPIDHEQRPLIILTAMKILNVSAGEFTRKPDQISEIVSKSFQLVDNPEQVCVICQSDLVDSAPRLTHGSKETASYLVCGGVYGDKCRHQFCYPCFQSLNATLIGDQCPTCREYLGGLDTVQVEQAAEALAQAQRAREQEAAEADPTAEANPEAEANAD